MQPLIIGLVALYSLTAGWMLPYIARHREDYKKVFLSPAQIITKFSKKDLVYRIFTSIFLALTLTYFTSMVFSFDNININTIIIILISIIVFTYLAYICIYDIIYFEIPDKSSLFFLFSLLAINLLLLTQGKGFFIELWGGNSFIPFLNLIGGLFYAGLIFILVVITKGKGMGGGDIRIAGIIGLLLGSKIFIAFYITIFSGLIIGLIFAAKSRKFKGLAIPFVPFMIFGTIISLLFSSQIMNFLWDLLLNLQPY